MKMTAKRVKKSVVQIVVADRGFVYVGNITLTKEFCTISKAQNIRYWGTERGLGQLALEGPTPKTKLDPVGTVIIPMAGVKHLIQTDGKKWKL